MGDLWLNAWGFPRLLARSFDEMVVWSQREGDASHTETGSAKGQRGISTGEQIEHVQFLVGSRVRKRLATAPLAWWLSRRPHWCVDDAERLGLFLNPTLKNLPHSSGMTFCLSSVLVTSAARMRSEE